MIFVMLGVGFLLCFMAIVIGTPFIYYAKRDQKWCQSDKKSHELWFS